jgi:hypothetical protein
MGITAAIIAALGAISAALGVVNILELSSEPILSEKLTWLFWMYLAIVLLLGSIACLLGRKQNYDE